MTNFLSKDICFKIGLIIIFVGVVFSSFYKLRESPPTWTDEGLIIQTSQNFAGQGVYGFQIGPGNIISPSFISTSFPVTYPIALSFKIFGTNLVEARFVMALYIILLFSSIFLIFKSQAKELLLWTLLFIGTFPPLYGHGKNVLGEIPGVFYIILSAFFLKLLEHDKYNLKKLFFFGFFFGLGLVTKPIFILAIPGFLWVVWRLSFAEQNFNFKSLGILFISSFVPFVVWVFTQFYSNDGWSAIIHYYSNPHSVDIVSAIILNLKDFFTNMRTLFAGGVFALWTLTLIYKYNKAEKVPLFETYLFSLSFLAFILYFRNPPYYRYFFIPEILSLAFFTTNLFYLSMNRLWLKNVIRLLLIGLLAFQFYQLAFNSWVADSYKSIKTEVMQNVIGAIPSDKTVFFYQTPEAVIFLKSFNYYQYFSGTATTEFGQENLHLIKDSNDLLVITRKEVFFQKQNLFTDYHIKQEFDRYVVLQK